MAEKITDYPGTVVTLEDDDLIDVSVNASGESEKMPWSVFKTNMENASGRNGTESLTAGVPKVIVFSSPLPSVNYSLSADTAFTSGGDPVPIKRTDKIADGFTAEAPVDCDLDYNAKLFV